MIELTLGAIAAALIAKALDRAEGKAVEGGESVLRRLVEVVQGRLSTGGSEQSAALDRVAEVPDSPSRVEALARLLDERVDSEPEFGRELDALVKEARGSGIDVESISQVAYGNQNVQNAHVSDSEIKVSFGGAGSASPPRRISD